MKFGIFIGFLSLFAAAECGLLGAKECTYGPAYWCNSIKNAKECNAVKHCIQTVWEKQVLPEDNDDVCTICKDMVKEAREQLLSNETQEEIRAVFEGSCKLIPLTLIREECIKFSDEFIPELIDTLASQMNPQAVCATAGLCNSARVDRLLLKYKKKHPVEASKTAVVADPRPGDCKDCKKFITDVTEIVKSHPRSVVLDHLLAICARLSTLSDGCMALVQSNFEEIYIFLTRTLNPDDVCDLFGMCSRLYGKTTVSLTKTGDEPCDFCVAVVTNWRNNLVANTTKDEFKMILEGLCHQTGSFGRECMALVDQYFEELYDILVSQVRPKEICEAVGLCGDSSVFKNDVPIWPLFEMSPENHLPLFPLNPTFENRKLIGEDEANSYKVNAHLPRVSLGSSSISVVSIGKKGVVGNPQSGDACVMCEFVLHFLQNALQDNQTREEIKAAVEKVCLLLPHTVVRECDDYIEGYGNQLIDLLSQNIDPSVICPLLNLCPGEEVAEPILPKDTTCVMCEYAMTELDEILKDKSNEAAIRNAVDRVCSLLPKSVSSECKSFIDMYIDQIVDLIANDFTPRQICQQLGLCNAIENGPNQPFVDAESAQLPVTRYFIPNVFQMDTPPKKELSSVKQSSVCVICEFVLQQVDSFILQNSTEKDIESAVDKVCVFLPRTLMNDCLGFMEEYGDALIELLVNQLDPAFVCRELRLCKDTFLSSLPVAQVRSPVDDCMVCNRVMTWVEQNKGIVDSEAVSEALLMDLCSFLPTQAKETCTIMAFNHGSSLLSFLDELESTKRACQGLKMCPHHSAKPLLGAKKCTWGPSYWCQSRLHADTCQATQHCIENVWEDGVAPI